MMTKEVDLPDQIYQDRMSLYKYIMTTKGFEFVSEKALGKGAFGHIYRVKDSKSGEWKAVKIMKLRGDNDRLIRERFVSFKNEIFALIKNKHKNIIQLYDHFIVNNIFLSFIIMEFATEGDLRTKIESVYNKTSTGFAEDEAKDFFAQMANAMYYVHNNFIIHGDLKLENILITKIDGKEVVKVSDFGCARVAIEEDEETKETKAGTSSRALGTLTYMAPEQLKVYICVHKKRSDLIRYPIYTFNPFRADVWSLGVCFYRMLFYEFPFEFTNEKPKALLKTIQQMKSGAQTLKYLSPQCINILTNMMKYYKNDRYTMEQVMTDKWLAGSHFLENITRVKRQ